MNLIQYRHYHTYHTACTSDTEVQAAMKNGVTRQPHLPSASGSNKELHFAALNDADDMMEHEDTRAAEDG